jgi:hypothetical protein
MRFALSFILMGLSLAAQAKPEILKVGSCIVRASYLEESLKPKLQKQKFDISSSRRLSSDLAYGTSGKDCPEIPQGQNQPGLIVIGMLINHESIKIPLTPLDAILSQNCDEPIEIESRAKLCIYEISADGSSRLVVEKAKDFAANILRADSEVKDSARKWLAKQVPGCEEIR